MKNKRGIMTLPGAPSRMRPGRTRARVLIAVNEATGLQAACDMARPDLIA